ncbi:MAG TPA: ATP-binding protein [Candidatus Binataceae bacterium]|nr:ATP-binding protein [Candidatus Binataceae bacterium]
MLWENKQLRDVTEADLRQVIDSGLAEHLQLEYKSEVYPNNDRGNKESLLDICMFANAEGGVLLIGISELRDGQGQPTGMPDPDSPVGVEIQNPELALQALDARVTAAIEERLKVESAAVRLENGSYVLVLRIANSTAKPHCVRYQGHVYFPSRRQRSRYEMDVREIKELVMQTASKKEEAQKSIEKALAENIVQDQSPYLHISTVPLFSKEFLINLNGRTTRDAVANFDAVSEHPAAGAISYAFAGLERRAERFNNTVQLRRNGLVIFKRQLPTRNGENISFYPTAIDLQLRNFILRSRDLFRACEISGPYLLSMMLQTPIPLAARYAGAVPGVENVTTPIPEGNYQFPAMVIHDFVDIDSAIRPFCDNAHQAFGRSASPCFAADGRWIGI